MGSIILSNLKNTVKDKTGYTYTDLNLDIEEQHYTNTGNFMTNGKDIRVSYDEEAIKNSLVNIFNTTPGERFLLPEFGSNLKGYLFSPITKHTADAIGNHILYSIQRWEPRVIVDYVNVIGKPIGMTVTKDLGNFSPAIQKYLKIPVQEDEYIINVIIAIPLLKKRTDLEGVLTVGGFKEIKL